MYRLFKLIQMFLCNRQPGSDIESQPWVSSACLHSAVVMATQ